MSKVLLVNGSSRQEGNTSVALAEVAAALEGHGVETETMWLGNKPVNDCIACGKCAELGGKCAIDNDVVNELIAKAAQVDGFVFGTPVYYAHPSGRILCALDRAFYAGGAAFRHKPGAAVAVARRGGTTASFDVLNKHFTICEMPVVSSTYWNAMCTGACRARPRRMRRACRPCATSGRTWRGCSSASKPGKPRASTSPSPSATR